MQPESPTEGSDEEALHEVWDTLLKRERDRVTEDWAPTTDDGVDEEENGGLTESAQ